MLLLLAPALAGCGRSYLVLHPAGPVGRVELRLIVLSTIAVGAVVAVVFAIFALVLARYRDVPGRRHPYTPNWSESPVLEILWFIVPALVVTILAVPTVRETFNLAKVPPVRNPLVIDVTSLSWKWLFEYPGQHLATVNYAVIPTGQPVLFELTANSPMNAFWVPQLGGMVNAMPGRVLPLWLQADRPGTYWGRSSQFSGLHFDRMSFDVRAETPEGFAAWADQVHRAARPMSLEDYRRLLDFGTAPTETYSGFPAGTFPPVAGGPTLEGSMYTLAHNRPQENWPVAEGAR